MEGLEHNIQMEERDWRKTCQLSVDLRWRTPLDKHSLSQSLKYLVSINRPTSFLAGAFLKTLLKSVHDILQSWCVLHVFVLSCVCYLFVRVCLYVLCGHLLGKV